MVDVRDITHSEQPPENADCVVIDPTPGGKFVANGSASGKKSATFFKPPAFATLQQAIAASRQWAEENDVPVVYVRGIPKA